MKKTNLFYVIIQRIINHFKKLFGQIPRIIKTKVAEPSLCCMHRFLTSLYTVIFSLQLQLRVRVCCVRDRAKDKKRKVVGSWKERNSLSCYTYVMCIYACSYFHRFHNLVFMYFGFILRTGFAQEYFNWLWPQIYFVRLVQYFGPMIINGKKSEKTVWMSFQ